MRKSIVMAITVVLAMMVAAPCCAQFMRNGFNDFAAPTLLYPSEKADLSGKDVLKFKWEAADTIDIDHFEFRVYKGYVTAEAFIFAQQDVDSNASYAEVNAALFEDGQVYTWRLRAISREGYKSDAVYTSFTVTKK